MSLTVNFTNTSTGDIAAVLWEFGDGSYQEIYYPASFDTQYTYAAGGTYDVTLHVFGVWGSYDYVIHPVTVTNAIDPCGILFDFTASNGGWYVPSSAQNVYFESENTAGNYSTGVGWEYGDVSWTQSGHVYRARVINIQLDVDLSAWTPSQVIHFNIVTQQWRATGLAIPHAATETFEFQAAEAFSAPTPAIPTAAPAITCTYSENKNAPSLLTPSKLCIHIESSYTEDIDLYRGYVNIESIEITC